MFKFHTKGDNNNFEAAVFYNGQRVATLYAWKYLAEFTVQVEDGEGIIQADWVDYEESD
jgi:hypothetical protein